MKKNNIGYIEKVINLYILEKLNATDLRSFGLIPELLGRFPIVTHLDKLIKETMLRILTEPKNSIINQFVELFRLDGIKLAFTDQALEKIVDYTIDKGLGARGLRGTTEKILEDYMYRIDELEKELIIDGGNILEP